MADHPPHGAGSLFPLAATPRSGKLEHWRSRPSCAKMPKPLQFDTRAPLRSTLAAREDGAAEEPMDETARRGNYESGADYVLEYGELRFSFNEQDFAQRVEQAAVKLDFVRQGLDEHELEHVLELAVNGEIREPCS